MADSGTQEREDAGAGEGLGGLVHAVQDAVSERVAPATTAVTSALHEVGQVAAHLRARILPGDDETEDAPDLAVPSGALIVRPAKHSKTFLAWRGAEWAPVRREHGTGWVWCE